MWLRSASLRIQRATGFPWKWSLNKGEDKMREYQQSTNGQSIDDLLWQGVRSLNQRWAAWSIPNEELFCWWDLQERYLLLMYTMATKNHPNTKKLICSLFYLLCPLPLEYMDFLIDSLILFEWITHFRKQGTQVSNLRSSLVWYFLGNNLMLKTIKTLKILGP